MVQKDSQQSSKDQRARTAAQADDGIPAGDSPPQSMWPMVVAFVAWGGWVVFLTVMAVLRFRQT